MKDRKVRDAVIPTTLGVLGLLSLQAYREPQNAVDD